MKDLIQKKLEQYRSASSEEEEHALKEIAQEIILYSLFSSHFFNVAAFHGGTCLRIAHQLDRFSEDLDFVLHKEDSKFDLDAYLKKSVQLMSQFGFEMEITGAQKSDTAVQKRFLKNDSLKKILTFSHPQEERKKIKIKLEVDTRPPAGATTELKYLDFPTDYTVVTHDLPSLLAGKCHALLCRNYVKGRDWYDFSWYGTQNTRPNFELLTAALDQAGPWRGQKLKIDSGWLRKTMTEKIHSMNWEEVKKDVSSFLRQDKLKGLEIWSADFFMSKLKKIT